MLSESPRVRAIQVAAVPIVGLLAACSGGSNASLAPPGPQSVPMSQRLGGAPNSAGLPALGAPFERLASPEAIQNARKSIPKDLYVADLSTGGGVIILKNGTYKEVGTITNGMSVADGLWVDEHGHLYAANVDGGNATEYAPRAKSPMCSYSGLNDPINVTTDARGHVYVIDWNYGFSGAVVEYDHCKDKVVQRYAFDPYSSPESAAVDASGNLFVYYYDSKAQSQGALEEFPAGSTLPTPLGATTVFPGGMVLDKHGNLIVADQGVAGAGNGAVDVIAPPYSTATPLVSNLAQPFHLSLNKRENLLFVTSYDFSTPAVWVMSYPSGTIKTTLGASNGLAYPVGVGESPGAVF